MVPRLLNKWAAGWSLIGRADKDATATPETPKVFQQQTIALSLGVAQATEAQTKGTAQGFGGFSVNQAVDPLPSLGGTVTVALTEHVQVVGEVGRLGNVAPSVASSLLEVPGVHVSALSVFDAGYRYKQLLDTNVLSTVFGLGQNLRSNDVRVGIGFRF